MEEENRDFGFGVDIARIDRSVDGLENINTEQLVLGSEIDIRSQRLSDTHPVRAAIYDNTNPLPVRWYRRFASQYILQPIIHILFPRVLNNQRMVRVFGFTPTTQVKLLCPWTCEEGHICENYEGHTGKHKCVFGHVEDQPILKCGHVCDCKGCEAECVYKPGHRGIHKCYFRHLPRDIPSNRTEQEAFRDDKAIGDYIDELAYISPEEMKFSHIPECLDPKDEEWVTNK